MAVMCDGPRNARLLDHPEAMGAGRYSERRIIPVHGIEMNAQSEHPGEDFDRRRNVHDPGLCRPRPEPRDIAPLAHAYRPVLMPVERPVRIAGLVEKDRTHEHCSWSDQVMRNGTDRIIASESLSHWLQFGDATPGTTGRPGQPPEDIEQIDGCARKALRPVRENLHALRHA